MYRKGNRDYSQHVIDRLLESHKVHKFIASGRRRSGKREIHYFSSDPRQMIVTLQEVPIKLWSKAEILSLSLTVMQTEHHT